MFHDLDVRVCAVHKGTISAAPWSLIGSDSSNNATTVIGVGLHDPQYPSVGDGKPVTAGECISGWIAFFVARSVRIVAAKYALVDTNKNTSVQAKWRLR